MVDAADADREIGTKKDVNETGEGRNVKCCGLKSDAKYSPACSDY